MSEVRVLVADDHRAFADAIAIRLEAEPDIAVVGVAGTAASAEEMARSLQPDVIVLDVEFGDGDGIEVARRLREEAPQVRIVVVTFHDDTLTASSAARAGVAGFLAKDASTEELVGAIRIAARGGTWIHERVLGRVLEELAQGSPRRTPEQELFDRLTQREADVLDGMIRGLDRASIGRELYLSTNTVRTHTRNLLAKLGVHSSLEAVALALRAGVRPRGQGQGGPRRD